ncbi:hypothetical protein CHLNCDRAFT_136442 [Chlorella variabilis]|uniref:Chitinase n=1 Tax=Chlorella variabilis TaxID=554065 RepID=E1ZKD2_CHLVA|nr:hypothetical protein CHLNCDRAFT_136442 [Chlorella variabilis]EFN53671.1 hypothetical protein CHLNCDRAFT_136442 [Chlorella variabilis]|eukprot:XP_005845773.1 hypothetical protein CHLNCDRAFT_136442 [Chlorella variabilis]
MSLSFIAGTHAALAPGNYTLRLPGFLSARACSHPFPKTVTLTPELTLSAGTGLQVWQLQPVAAGVTAIKNTTKVYLKVGRPACGGNSYATSFLSCTGLSLSAPVAGSARQQWLVEAWGATYRLRPAACPGVYLGFSSADCSKATAALLSVGTGKAVAFSFARQDEPAPSPPPPSPSPPTPSPSPSPPPPSPPPESPPPTDDDSIKPPVVPPAKGVTVTLVKSQVWGNGDPRGTPYNTSFEASFSIKNSNAFYILNWRLHFSLVGWSSFTWGPSDTDLKYAGTKTNAQVVLTPKEWLREIPPGTTLSISFGGQGVAPSAIVFEQILPLLDPDHDISLSTRGAFPQKLFAPFVDATLYPTPRLLDAYEATGQKWFTLAFITADLRTREPAWGGVIPLWKQYFMDQIRDIRLLGGDCIVSFGGAAGQEQAQVRVDEDMLLKDYQTIVDLYKLRWIDFDIEGGAVLEMASVQRRHRVLKRLQDANPGLVVSFTLPVLPVGLTADGVNLLRDAKAKGVRLDVLNIMTMDYGDSAAPNPRGQMGDYAIQAAVNTRAQAQSVGYDDTKIGNTPMIGLNDVESEIFYLDDARKVGAWAKATPWLRWTAFWSVGRDKWNPAETYVSIHSSSIPQEPFEFTRIFKSFAS